MLIDLARASSERAIKAGIVEFSDSEGAMPAGEIQMLQELFEMQQRAMNEARKRYAAGDWKGGAAAAVFAFHRYEFARDLLTI